MRRSSTALARGVAVLAPLLVVALVPLGCATVNQILALRQVDFQIDRVTDGVLAGVDLRDARSANRLAAGDLVRIAAAVERGELPLSFTLHVGARNPQDNPVAARLLRLRWTLYMDGRRTIDGVTEREQVIQPGATVDVPLRMDLDLLRFFRDDARGLANVALESLGYGSGSGTGSGAGAPKLELRAQPTVMTDLGPIEYPGEIVIASR